MREIKFRGKRTDTGEWVYGSLMQWENGQTVIWVSNPIDSNVLMKYAVDPDTVGQYTGLKDRNGTDVWEGDILMCIGQRGDNKGHKYYRNVLFENGSFCMNVKYYRINSPLCNHIVTIVNKELDWEVIGNIHDDPELLEDGK